MYHVILSVFFLLISAPCTLSASKPPVTLDVKKFSYRKTFFKPISLKELAHTPFYTHVLDAFQTTYDGETVSFPEQFVIDLPEAEIIGNTGAILTAENRPFWDYIDELVENNFNWKMYRIKKTLESRFTQEPIPLDGAIVNLASPGEHCYYHWMLEILPRLKTVEMSGKLYDRVFVGGLERRYKKETLEELGITDDIIMYGRAKTNIKPDNVIIPSMPHLIQFSRPTWACDFVRSLFLDTLSTDTTLPSKKLYISRKNGSVKNSLRIIINEDEVVRYLEDKGFETVVLEDLSVREQAELFNAAQIIVAAHGASLTNLIFCDSHAPVTLIEIYQPQWINRCYTSLTEQLNHDRGFQFNHIRLFTSTEKLAQEDRDVGNIYVELDQLEDALAPQARSMKNNNNETLEHFGLIGNPLNYGTKQAMRDNGTPVIPSIPNLYDFPGTLEAYDLLRSTLLDDLSQELSIPGGKLYIARKKHSATDCEDILINERELTQYLEENGFTLVNLDELTIQEQARLFNAAEVIVAAEGASLTNLIFCNSKSPVHVIEIYNPDLINEYYATLARQLNDERNFKFNHIYCITSPDGFSEEDCEVHKIQVELDQLDKVLKELTYNERSSL